MPYRIDIAAPPSNAVDLLVDLGALDIESVPRGVAAILPDNITPAKLASILDPASIAISEATPRDESSVWLLSPRPIQIGSIAIAPPHATAQSNMLRLHDSTAFGTGHHPTTALCAETLEEILATECPDRLLDVGTGSGILALLALTLGIPQATGIDTDAGALQAAAENARLNHLENRLRLVHGTPDSLQGHWPLIVANVLAAPLIDMAPTLVRRLGPHGRLLLSGIPVSLEAEVKRAYQRSGLQHFESRSRAGWTLLLTEASW